MKKLLLVASLMLTGCVSVGTDFKWSAAKTLHPSMTTQEVVDILGKPYMVRNVNDVSSYIWNRVEVTPFMTPGSKTLRLDFKNDKLLGVPDLSQFKD